MTRPQRRETAAATLAALAFALLARIASPANGWIRGIALSTAAGTAYGLSSLLLRGLTQDLSNDGIGALEIGSVAGLVIAWVLRTRQAGRSRPDQPMCGYR